MRTSFSFNEVSTKKYFSVENVKLIIDKFQCKSSPEALAGKLNYAAGWYDVRKDISTPAEGKEGKTFFNEVAKLTEELKERLSALGWEIDRFTAAINQFGPPINLTLLQTQLEQIGVAAKYTVTQIPTKPAGRPDNIARKCLVADLHKIYQEETGRNDHVTYKAISDWYGGNFFDFVNECFHILRIKISNSGLGQLIADVANKNKRTQEPDQW